MKSRFLMSEVKVGHRDRISYVTDIAYKFAEHLLILGVFVFLAITTKHWAVITITLFLTALLCVNLISFLAGVNFTNRYEGDGKAIKVLWIFVDFAIFGTIIIVVIFAVLDVVNTMSNGTGI